ncbi:aldo/keto reductase [Flavobacterium sp.]|uniref:aldo/keto reductase n=1 Tax=Flavobacterium sp. TaxID=239 RepID=UPI002625D329|nr:aldo/keto reductase [Flavobacterium sp.]
MLKFKSVPNTELKTAPLIFGGNVFGWTIDEKTSFQLLNAFIDKGFNMIDTADIYSRWAPGNVGGESEKIIGKWLSDVKNRDKIIIATKAGMDMGEGKVGLKAAYLKSAVEQSLRNLKTDYIDLFQSHQDDPETAQDETLRAYDELIQAGKIRYIGASNFTADRLQEASEIARSQQLQPYRTLQPYYNLYTREKFEGELQNTCAELQLAVIPYFSLESGFLTGKYRSTADLQKSIRGGRFANHFNERGMRILSALDALSAAHNVTPAAIALAWLLKQETILAPIASATSVMQLNELLAVADINLNTDEIRLLNLVSASS